MKTWVWASAGAVVAAAIIAAVLLQPAPDPSAETEAALQESSTYQDYLELQARLEEQGLDVHTDSDGDGLPDVMENFLYGSDPHAFSTTGNGIPDGWFARNGYDPTIAGVENRPAAIPPADALPEVYGGHWPDKYRWTLADVYTLGMPDQADETYWDNGLDPRQWRTTPDGLPTSWLAYHLPGFDFHETGLAGRSLTNDGFAVGDNYAHDTDPGLADTDGDGLSDLEEVTRYGTDATRFSSSGTGVPDGWLVRHELDPLDAQVGSLDPAGKGMDVAQVWHYNVERFGVEEALDGKGLDPTQMSHRSDAVPDGWLVANGLDPLQADVTTAQSQCASGYEGVKHLDEAPEGQAKVPDLCLSVEQAYLHGRPAAWSEQEDGPWPGGLDPASGDQDGDGLPDAVEIRGWYVQRFVDVGPGAKGEWIRVTSDPLREDNDGDGLTDLEEHQGEAQRDGKTYRFTPSDPSTPDTAFSGMTDSEKVFASFQGSSWQLHGDDGGALRPLLDPARRDSAGDHLADGEAMAFWMQASQNVLDGVPYDDVYPGSVHKEYLDWINALPWLGETQLSMAEAAALLGPDGDADDDGVANIIDPSAAGDGLLNGWQVRPETLRFSDFLSGHPRSPTDPANPDTDNDGLPDQWELRHGRWDDTLGGWDLDPSLEDSDGDGDDDGEGNIDGDVVLWHSYGTKVTPNEWRFTNKLEFQSGTNPRVKDETGNGVSEGWVVFWASGRFYDRWVQDLEQGEPGDEDLADLRLLLGDRIPSMAQIAAVRDGPEGIANPLDPDVGRRVKDEVGYYRFITETDPAADAFHLGEGETFLEGWPMEVTVLRENGETTARIGIIEGTYSHTYAGDQAWGLNPYLDDTPGHGMRDAWASFYAPKCGAGLDPARPSARLDPDLDGVSNLQEYMRGAQQSGDFSSDPCLADTDLDGMKDGEEVRLNLDPLDPTDAALGGGELDDGDGDGIPDRQEVLAGKDPVDPDTDRDGLLDGSNRPPGQDTEWVDVWAADYVALGIAHREEACSSQHDGRYCFYGEQSNGADGTRPDKILSGIPDGWSVYWNQIEDDGTLQASYACGMPAWWDQSLLGVWWWGVSPTGDQQCPRDRDMDGLDDANGEDPVPAASQSNQQAATDLQGLMANGPADGIGLARAAQGWGECTGNPVPCFDAWQTATFPDQEPVRIEALQVTGPGVDLPSLELAKEEEFTVSGSLIVDSNGAPAPHRTVVVRLAGADPLAYDALSDDIEQDGITLGVGFTDDDGDFSFTACLCAAGGSIDVPDGLVALGRSGTTAKWQTSAAEVPIDRDPWTLGVQVYAGTAAFWGKSDETHPQYLEIDGTPAGTAALWHTIDEFTVTSATTLSLDAAKHIAWGDDRVLPVSVTLLDASGGPVPLEAVTVSIPGKGISDSMDTRHDGKRDFSFDLDGVVGAITIQASYAGSGGWAASSAFWSDTTLQAPLDLEISSAPGNVRLGEALEVSVAALSQDSPVAGVAVTATLQGLSQKQETGQDGVATFTLTPTDMDPGPTKISIRAATTQAFASATTDIDINLVSGSKLHANVAEAGALDAPLPLSGHLTLSNGAPLAGKKIQATLGDNGLGQFTTKSDGRFSDAPIVPLDLGIGVHTLRLVYTGDDAIDAATFEKQVRFSVGTHLTLEEVQAGRGQDTLFRGRLTSINGIPLVGEEIQVTLPWDKTVTVLARSGGDFTASVTIPTDHGLGAFQAHASYAGSPNGTYGASTAKALLAIGSPSRIEPQPMGILHRGNNTIHGRLLDDETGAPIARAEIQATTSIGDPLLLRTDDEGRYQFSLSLPRDIPAGDIRIDFRFDGDDGYAPTEASTEGVLRVPASLTISAPRELGRGTTHPVSFLLTDDRKVPLANRDVTLTALGATRNATTDAQGRASLSLDVPLATDLGATRLDAAFSGDEAHDAAQASRDATVKDGVRIAIHGMPEEVRPGQHVTLRIHVSDTNGQPVKTPLAVRMEGVPGSLLIETNDAGDADATIMVPDTTTNNLHVTVRFPGTELLASRAESLEPLLGTASHAAAPTTWPWGITAGAATLVAASVALAMLLRRRAPTATDILQDTQKRIDAGDPWSTAILDAYRRLVDLVKAYGIEDVESQTGRAFAQTLVDAGFLHERAAMDFLALFERARYAGENLKPADAQEAQRVLQSTLGSVQSIEARRGGVA